MPDPYRTPAHEASFPAEQIAWRRSVAQGAVALLAFVLFKYLALGAVEASPGVAALVLTPVQLGLCFATWKLTAPAPERSHATGLGWVLRGIVVAGALTWPLGLLGLHVRLAAGLLMLAATGAGLVYVAGLFRAFEAPRHVWLARVAASTLTLAGLPLALTITQSALYGMLLLGAVLLAFYCLVRLMFVLRVAHHELFWRDDGVLAPEWVALFLLADGRAEAFDAGGRLGYFASRTEAEAWLDEHGVVRDKALAALAGAQPE